MKAIARLLVGLALFGICAAQEEEELPTFDGGYDFTLSASAATFSIQSPAGNTMRGLLVSAYVRSSAACTVEQYIGGSVSGGTVVSTIGLNTDATSTMIVKRDGTHTGGNKAEPTYDLVAGIPQVIDLSDVMFSRGKASIQTYVLKSSTCTGTLRIALKYKERSR